MLQTLDISIYAYQVSEHPFAGSKELSFSHKFKCSNPYIFATRQCKPVQTANCNYLIKQISQFEISKIFDIGSQRQFSGHKDGRQFSDLINSISSVSGNLNLFLIEEKLNKRIFQISNYKSLFLPMEINSTDSYIQNFTLVVRECDQLQFYFQNFTLVVRECDQLYFYIQNFTLVVRECGQLYFYLFTLN